MEPKHIARLGLVVAALMGGGAYAAKDRLDVPGPNGIALSEFRGYETWQAVAPSQTEGGLKVIVANPVMINAYKAGIPDNGKPVPDGAMFAKIEWISKKDTESPYPVVIPDTLKLVGFMIKDSKRFRESDGWGYAQFLYDPATDSFKSESNDPDFGKKVCHQCHTLVSVRDFVFTAFPKR